MKKFFLNLIYGFIVSALAEDDIFKETTCVEQEPERLFYEIDSKSAYYRPRNSTSEKVALLDYRHNMSLLGDGLTGAAFVFSYETGHVVYIPPGASGKTWNVKEQSYEDYFENFPGTEELFSIGEKVGYQFDPETVTDEMSEALVEILASLSSDYSSKCEALAIFLHVCKETSDNLKTNLAGFEEVMGQVKTELRGNFKWLVGIFLGMADFFNNFPNGINSLNQKNLQLDFSKIATAPTGIHVLIYFLEELNPHFNLGEVLQPLNVPDKFFTQISKLAGEMNDDFDGFIHIVSEIMKYTFEENSKPNLMMGLKAYLTNQKADNNKLNEKWKTSVQDLLQTIKRLRLDGYLMVLTNMLQEILHNRWVMNGVNMSHVTNLIMNVDRPGNDDDVEAIIAEIEEKECCHTD